MNMMVSKSELNPAAQAQDCGTVFAAWPVVPGALLLLGCREGEAPPLTGIAQLDRRALDRGPFRCLAWPLATVEGTTAFVAAVRLPVKAEPRPGAALMLHGEGRPLVAAMPSRFVDAAEFAREAARLTGRREAEFIRFLLKIFPTETLQRLAAVPAMIAEFLACVALPDGCVEVISALPDSAAALQGWGTPEDGPAEVVLTGRRFACLPVHQATFARPDISLPASGLFDVLDDVPAGTLEGLREVFVLTPGKVRRREVVALRTLGADEGASHLAGMLPRLSCPPQTEARLRDVLRPRFDGRNTLAAEPRPVRAVVDVGVFDPAVGVLVGGWICDPQGLAAEIRLRGTRGFNVRIDQDWVRIPRPDVTDAFRNAPGFTAPPSDAHGFTAFAAGVTAAGEALYLQVAFADGHCAFLPVAAAPADAAVRLALLADVDLYKPSGPQVIERHVAPFLARLPALPPDASVLQNGARGRAEAIVVALPEPVLPRAFLSQFLTDPLQEDEGLVLVCGPLWDAARRDELRRLTAFLRLPTTILQATTATATAALAAAAVVSGAGRFLLAGATTAGCAPGWRAALRAALAATSGLACVCPTLVYEDWSIRYAGAEPPTPLADAPYVAFASAFAGLPATLAGDGAARPVAAGTLGCCLLPRAALARLGPARGSLLTAEAEEAAFFLRLRAAGVACIWVPEARVWALEEAVSEAPHRRAARLADGWALRDILQREG